jgi:hypothetical protein
MRLLFVTLMVFGLVQAQNIDKKWETSDNCKGCHNNITSKWEQSRHANSHYSKNDLFKKTLEYMATKNPTKVVDEIKLECAKCHNPRIGIKNVKAEDKIAILFEDENVTQKYNHAFETKTVKNGINCIVCHNIDKIHLNKKRGSQGMGSVYFGEQGTMFGPFDDAHSPYHKTKQRDHFAGDNPKLCFVCHYSAKNEHNVPMYQTGIEYDEISQKAKDKIPGCKSCHMSKRKKGFASNYAKVDEKPKMRMVRVHRFASIDNSDIIKDYIDVKGSFDEKNNKFIIDIKNQTPHKLPTGYGLRKVIIDIEYFDSKNKSMGRYEYILGAKYVDDNGKDTIPHMATKLEYDNRLNPYRQRKLKFPVPNGAVYVEYKFTYRLIDEKLAKEIGVSDEFFLKDYLFYKQKVHL